MAHVGLIYPPVVFSNFGRYYPSTAMLAAFLEQHGVGSTQFDLNMCLLEHLLEPCRLRTLASPSPEHGVTDLDDWNDNRKLAEVAAARCAIRLRDRFFDSQGRAKSRPSPPMAVLEALSYKYYLDPPTSMLCSEELYESPIWLEIVAFIESRTDLKSAIDDADLVGITVPMGPQLVWALALARHISNSTGALVVLGGPTITLMEQSVAEQVLQAHPYVGALVRHQGEEPLLELALAISGGNLTDLKSPNIMTIERPFVQVQPQRISKKLDGYPAGSYDVRLLAHLASPEISIRQAEGCYWGRCAYCDYVELYPKSGPRYRPRGIALIADEMESHLARDSSVEFVLITEAIPPKAGVDLADEILSRGLRARWSSFAMVDHRFTPSVLRRMADGGCSTLYVGVETVIDRVLQKIEKKASRAETWRFFESCRQAGIALVVNLIPNLPTTTRAEALEALDELKERLDDAAWINIFPFEATASSKIGRNPEKYGLSVTNEEGVAYVDAQAEYSANHLHVVDSAMTDMERSEVIRAYRLFANRLEDRRLPAQIGYAADDGGLVLSQEAELLFPPGETEGPIVFAGMTGKLIQFPPEWSELLRHFASEGRLTRKEIPTLMAGIPGVESFGLEGDIVTLLRQAGIVADYAQKHSRI